MQAQTFSALGEPSRLEIVELLRRGPQAVGQIADTLAIRQPQVSKHLRVLNEVGIVAVEPVARHRIYHLQPAPFTQMAEWVDSFDRLWEVRLDALGRFLDTIEGRNHDD